MAPFSAHSLSSRAFDPGLTSREFSTQWRGPNEVFSVLLILGGDVVAVALAQLCGGRLTPVAFSFGWVSYAVIALVSVVGENRLMRKPDFSCKVINGKVGYIRDNSSWIIGRMVRDFEYWMDPKTSSRLDEMIEEKWQKSRGKAERVEAGSGKEVKRPKFTGLCVSIYKAGHGEPGQPGHDIIYYSGFVVTIIQLGIAAVPCGLFGDWGTLLITICGIVLSFATGSLPQWSKEKWACRRKTKKDVILTAGNGSQHAIVVLGDGRGLDLEDLAAGQTRMNILISRSTRVAIFSLALLWVVLLIAAASLKENSWFLLATGGIGILQNIVVAGCRRNPEAFGVPLTFVEVIGEIKIMATLYKVEEKYPGLGRNMLDTFFPGKLRDYERDRWNKYGAHHRDNMEGKPVAVQHTAAVVPEVQGSSEERNKQT
ncbi:hypothetical protein AJ79_00216 [Helicocarpus griseus UAMH5409]|uniref:Uncharacterized protein n=1 Tax=Helicocarpus griseus UAMH5409 TaxID=1447875 RepID=A0A2B7YCP0_9EURO|nr:hypothetical protein AJ79_00216 [Helicocarpus griseus UAMH5409]